MPKSCMNHENSEVRTEPSGTWYFKEIKKRKWEETEEWSKNWEEKENRKVFQKPEEGMASHITLGPQKAWSVSPGFGQC